MLRAVTSVVLIIAAVSCAAVVVATAPAQHKHMGVYYASVLCILYWATRRMDRMLKPPAVEMNIDVSDIV